MRASFFFSLISIFSLSSVVYGQDSFSSMRTLAMSEAFVGGGTGTGALFVNPAGIAMSEMYAVETGYVYSSLLDAHSVGFAVADSKTNNNLSGGLGFTYELGNGRLEEETDNMHGYDVRVALALPLIPQTLAFGVTGHHLRYSQNIPTPPDPNASEPSEPIDEENAVFDPTFRTEKTNAYTGDIGVMFAPYRQILIGVTLHNLLEVENVLHRELEAGVGAYIEHLHLEASLHLDLETEQETFAIGAEYEIQAYPIRFGYQSGSIDSASGGIGWRSSGSGVDLVYVQDLTNEEWMFGISGSIFM